MVFNFWTYGNIEHLLSSICFLKKKKELKFYLQTRFQFCLDQEEIRKCLDIMIKKLKKKKKIITKLSIQISNLF